VEHNHKETIPGSMWTLAIGVLVTVISLWVGKNLAWTMPEQASLQAPLVDNLFDILITIGTALFLLTDGAIIYALIKFRHREGDNSDAEPIKGNLPLEIFWTAIPAIIVIFLGIYSTDVFKEMGGLEPPGHHMGGSQTEMAQAMTAPAIADSESSKYGVGAAPGRENTAADLKVKVTGLQFAWLFNYPETGIMSGELHVPIGKEVQLELVATDVLHAFWVPQFRIKQDVMPGKPSQMRFVATKTGTFPIVCAELCGSYHGGMRSKIYVHTPEEYDAWLAENGVTAQKQENATETVAASTQDMSDREFLEPYSSDLGVDKDTLIEIKSDRHVASATNGRAYQ